MKNTLLILLSLSMFSSKPKLNDEWSEWITMSGECSGKFQFAMQKVEEGDDYIALKFKFRTLEKELDTYFAYSQLYGRHPDFPVAIDPDNPKKQVIASGSEVIMEEIFYVMKEYELGNYDLVWDDEKHMHKDNNSDWWFYYFINFNCCALYHTSEGKTAWRVSHCHNYNVSDFNP